MGGIAQRVKPVTVESRSTISDVVRRALKRGRSDGPSSDGPMPSDAESEPDVEANPVAKAEPEPEPEPEPETEPTAGSSAKPEQVVKDVSSSPTDVLKNLLDMTHVPSGTEPSHFHSIAEALMQGFELCVTSKSSNTAAYELLEVEFYWYNQETGHIDPFTHAAEEQKVGGNWYFHRAPRRGPANAQSTAPVPSPKTNGFREGTRKGLDLTFGTPPCAPTDAPVAYGGILFRTIRNIQTKKVTCGPSLLVDELLRASEIDSLPTLVHGSIRPQTFYGLLQLHEAGQLTRMGIADVSGMKPSQISTYYGYLEAGRNAGRKAVTEFISESGKGVGPSPSRFLKMSGVIECVMGDSGVERAQKRQRLEPTLTSMFAGAKKKA
ncbi:hypothetical protein OPQ81_002918 [Rhizoctonia solani]|nr:hypothetical protein OPQ81_002918 [Rhizoctonia solani]